MKHHEFHPEALDEMREAGVFYDGRRLGLGDELLDEIQRKIAWICGGHTSGSPWIHNTRLQKVRRFSYGIVYREYPDQVFIIAIYYLTRREDYWVHRLDDLPDDES
jgi:hypothetical protein